MLVSGLKCRKNAAEAKSQHSSHAFEHRQAPAIVVKDGANQWKCVILRTTTHKLLGYFWSNFGNRCIIHVLEWFLWSCNSEMWWKTSSKRISAIVETAWKSLVFRHKLLFQGHKNMSKTLILERFPKLARKMTCVPQSAEVPVVQRVLKPPKTHFI